MPATTIPQQKLFGMALAQKRGKAKGASKKVKELAKGMSEKKLKEFASTKHKGLKESFVLSFAQFVNESEHELGKSYVTPEGELKDLEFTSDERMEIMSYDEIIRLKEFFEDAGAEEMTYVVKEGTVRFKFEYRGDPMLMILDLDQDRSRLIDLRNRVELFKGSAEALIDLISAKGFDFMDYGQ